MQTLSPPLRKPFPTIYPRSWERVSSMLQTFGKDDDILLNKAIYGLIGNQAGVEFCAFREISAEFDNVYELMMNPKANITIPGKADQRYAFCAAVVYHLWRGTDENTEKKLLDGFYRIAIKLPSDFATLMMMDAMTGNAETVTPVFADKLFQHPKYLVWAELHGKAMRSRLNRKAILK